MKNVIMTCVCATFVLSGCASTGENTKKGAAVGGLLGAASGAIIGHQSGERDKGALVGGLLGAAAGGAYGHHKDQQVGTTGQARASATQQLTIEDIGDMAASGVPSSAIISEIERTGTRFRMTNEKIHYLKGRGVENDVIDFMLIR